MFFHAAVEALKRIFSKLPLRIRRGAPDVHERVLVELRALLLRGYKGGNAKEMGEPLCKGITEDTLRLERYFKSGHFHKNYYTNYHALWNLFCQKGASIPEVFYVYDLACGPYTATLSLMNFLHNDKQDIQRKTFYFTFCDMGDLCLDKLHGANANS